VHPTLGFGGSHDIHSIVARRSRSRAASPATSTRTAVSRTARGCTAYICQQECPVHKAVGPLRETPHYRLQKAPIHDMRPFDSSFLPAAPDPAPEFRSAVLRLSGACTLDTNHCRRSVLSRLSTCKSAKVYALRMPRPNCAFTRHLPLGTDRRPVHRWHHQCAVRQPLRKDRRLRFHHRFQCAVRQLLQRLDPQR